MLFNINMENSHQSEQIKLFSGKEKKAFDDMCTLITRLYFYVFIAAYAKDFSDPVAQKNLRIYANMSRNELDEETLSWLTGEFQDGTAQRCIKDVRIYLENALSYFNKSCSDTMPIYIHASKFSRCIGFAGWVLNKYSCFDFGNGIGFGNQPQKPFERKFAEFIGVLERKGVISELCGAKYEIRPGDIVVYGLDNLAYTHIGIIYDEQGRIISKLGSIPFIYVTPVNNFYADECEELRVFRVMDEEYYNNFKRRFVPMMERLKFNERRKDNMLAFIKSLFPPHMVRTFK